MSTSLLIFGCGYLGQRVARAALAAGRQVAAVTRSAERAKTLASEGMAPIVADITDPASLREFKLSGSRKAAEFSGLTPAAQGDEFSRLTPAAQGEWEAETVLFAVGYDKRSGQTIDEVYVRGLEHVLDRLATPPRRFIYISTTGVYGQVAGDWVDEDSPCVPTRPGGNACLAAERLLQARLPRQAIILRLAGIYGPGRIPRSDDIRAGRPIDAPAEGFLNLIHVDDAARIVLAAEQLSPPRLYVVSDGHPVLRSDYYAELARLLDAPPPTFSSPDPASAAAQRAGSDKRIRPARLFADHNLSLQYPDYRAGLAAITRGEPIVGGD